MNVVCLIATLLLSADVALTYERPKGLIARNQIDQLVAASLQELRIKPANVCSDATFLRRAFLDVIGTLPTLAESRQFLASTDESKREDLIEQLLQRDQYADYWAMKWCDALRVKAEFPINLWPNAAQAYHRWVRTSVKENKPYDQFARELLTSSGSNFRVPPVNFYRATQTRDAAALAQVVALTFLGERVEHWPEERREGLAACFARVGYKPTAEWKEEIVFFDVLAPASTTRAILPDGTIAELSPTRDPRLVFTDWLIRRDNPSFARCAVNRYWHWIFGRGLVHEADDLRPDNPPSNPALLEFLEDEFIRSGYDAKALLRLILNSTTYQLSSIPQSDHPQAREQFAYYQVRRLDAEVLIDAICQVTGTTEEYSSSIPEPFTFIPDNLRSIALPDGSVTSAFLEAFGRPSRDTGMLSERNDEMTAAQRLHLLNSTHIQKKIAQSEKLRGLIRWEPNDPKTVVTRLYLTILSRPPSAAELETLAEFGRSGKFEGADAYVDLTWTLINSTEFLYRH